MKTAITVYCSGPLFSPEETAGMTALAQVLETAGYATFLPHRDGLEPWVLPFLNAPVQSNVLKHRDAVDRAIFALDVYQLLERCQGMVVNLNGRTPDEGAVVEAALAYSAGKALVMYKNDARSAFSGRENSMLFGLTGRAPVKDLHRIPAELKKALTAKGREPASASLPRELQNTLVLGRSIWTVLEQANRLKDAGSMDAALVKEILALSSGAGK